MGQPFDPLKRLLHHRCDNRPIDLPADAILGFMVVRNETKRLPYCLDYHRRLGVSRFFVVDNDSEDASAEWLLAQPDVHLWHTTTSFGAARCGTDWTEALLKAYGQGRWCLVLDADELLVYPGCETRPLADFCAQLEQSGYRATMAIMIDMYSDRSLRETPLQAGQSFTEVCGYFDPQVYHDKVECFYEHDQHPSFFGGVRRRVFGGHEPGQDERMFYCLNKVPLLKYDDSFVLSDNLHWTSCREVAVQAACLLHFKFFAAFAAQAVTEAQRQEHWSGGVQYARYAEVLNQRPDLSLFDPAISVRYEDSAQLAALGLLNPLLMATNAPPPTHPEAPMPDNKTPILRQVCGMIIRRLHQAAHGVIIRRLRRGHEVIMRRLYPEQRMIKAISAPSYFNLGEAHLRLEQWSEAADCYRRALDLQADLPNAARSLARALARQARQLEREAQHWYGRAHALNPADMEIYAEAIDLRPPDPDLCLQFADTLAGCSQHAKAIFFYQLALQVRPNDATPHARLAATLRQEGDLASAISCCRQAILLDESRAEYHAQLGAMLAAQGHLEEAIRAYQRGLALEPTQPAWHKESGDLLARAGRMEEAATAYAQAVSHGYEPY